MASVFTLLLFQNVGGWIDIYVDDLYEMFIVERIS